MTLTPQQAETVKERIFPTVGYVVRLRERMDKVGCTREDRLYQLACGAENAMRGLWIALHYMSCERGVCMPLEK